MPTTDNAIAQQPTQHQTVGAFTRLWAAYAVSTVGTWLAFNALALIAVDVLHSGPAHVAALSAGGLAVGALLALPLGRWTNRHSERTVLIISDLARFAIMASIPLAYLFDALTFAQLLLVSVLGAAADIAFRAASGAWLKTLVAPAELLRANARFESTMWTATVIGPPLGGVLIGLFGPVTTVLVDAASYVLSALGIRTIRRTAALDAPPPKWRELFDGWRFVLAHQTLRPLLFTSVAFNGLLLATEPLLVVLLLRDLGFPAWQYGLAFALPCLAGLFGARLSGKVVARIGAHRTLLFAGTLRVCWPLGLAFVPGGVLGLVLIIALQFVLVFFASIFAPVLATRRLELTPGPQVRTVLSSWSITNNLATATLTMLWGVLAACTSTRIAIALAGVLLLLTPLLLPRKGNN